MDAMNDETSRTVFRLPRSHWHCDIASFAWDNVRPRALRQRYLEFLEQAAAGEAPHLLLTGEPGIGKTHLGVAAYRWMVARVGTELATWLNVPTFCDQVKAGYTNGAAQTPLEEYEDARRFVVLDDLFGRDLTTHEASQIVYRLLDIAYQNRAAMLITMNQDAQDLASRLPPHEVSRVLAGAKIIPMVAEQDWRRR
jgi:DNA replication protein DnaC